MALNLLILKGLDRDSKLATPTDLWETVEWFLQFKESDGCSSRTIEFYRQQLRYFKDFVVDPVDPHVNLDEITDDVIVAYLTKLRTRTSLHTGKRSQQKLSPWTVKAAYVAVRAFFKWCKTRGYIKAVPTDGLTARTGKLVKQFLPEGTYNTFLALCPTNTYLGARDAAVLELLRTTPMRRAECTGLALDSLEWKANRIKVLGKRSKERYVPFETSAKKAMLNYLDYRRRRRSASKQTALWLSEEGKPLSLAGFEDIMKRLSVRSGLQYRDICHCWRRDWAMRQLASGVSMKFVQLVGGWEDIKTLEGYVAAMESDQALGAKFV